jgi:hypothetical protein
MTKMLERGIEAVRSLSADCQDMAGEILLGLAGKAPYEYELTPDQLDDVKTAIGQADRGEFATDQEMAAVWKKFGR